MLFRQRFKTVADTVELVNFVRMHGVRGFPQSLKRKLKVGSLS